MENEELLPKPQTDLPLPEKEIPAHVASQGDPLRSYKLKWLKLGIVFVVLLVLLGGVYMLGKNNAGKQVSQTPIGSPKPTAEAATPNPTANWKTYRNAEFTVKYPGDTFIDESTACNFVKTNSLGLFKKRATGKYLCGSDEPYYFYINSVNKKEITSNDSCYTVTKEATILDELPAEKYTTSFHNNDKSCGERGIGPISKEVKSVYITHKAKLYLINWPILDVDETIYDQILSTFQFTDQASSTDTSTWKTYTDSKYGYTIKYPSIWTIDSSNKDNFKLLSPDYQSDMGFGGPGKGLILNLYVRSTPFSGNLGLKSTENISWLNQPATLTNYTYELDDWVITSKFNGVDYQLVATVAKDQVWIENKEIILEIADSLKIKN